MMYTELNYLIAQQHAAEARRTAEREQLIRRVADRPARTAARRLRTSLLQRPARTPSATSLSV